MPKRVHVLFLDTNDAMGGVVQVHLNLLKHLDRAQFRLSLACQSCGMLVDQFNTIAKVERIPIDAGTKSIKQCRSMKAALYDAVSLTRFWRTVLTLTRYCSKEKVQLIYTSDKKRSVMLATVLSRITGLPFVYHIHNVYVDYRLNRRALRGANAVFANSHAMKAHFVQSLGRGMDRIQVVHNGVDTDVFKPSAGSKLRNYLGLSDAVTVIGVAARLAPEKGHPVLLAAAADLVAEKHHRFHLVIVGDDRIYSNNTGYVQQLQTMVTEASLQDNVTFLGFRKDMSDVYNGLDIVVDPAWEEAFGMVVVEPMACGKTVVGT
ncbi:MAG: glycosyltransferase, partial [Kiritimatiellales bacterium]|nr:glycosyltransferase [Kiritimatiellales bacterium]